MSSNTINSGVRVRVKAAAARVGGTLVLEQGLVGVPVANAQIGEIYSLDIQQGVKRFPTVAGSNKGDRVYYTDSSGALTTSAGSGKRLLATVIAVGGTDNGPNPGESFWLMAPQGVAAA